MISDCSRKNQVTWSTTFIKNVLEIPSSQWQKILFGLVPTHEKVIKWRLFGKTIKLYSKSNQNLRLFTVSVMLMEFYIISNSLLYFQRELSGVMLIASTLMLIRPGAVSCLVNVLINFCSALYNKTYLKIIRLTTF